MSDLDISRCLKDPFRGFKRVFTLNLVSRTGATPGILSIWDSKYLWELIYALLWLFCCFVPICLIFSRLISPFLSFLSILPPFIAKITFSIVFFVYSLFPYVILLFWFYFLFPYLFSTFSSPLKRLTAICKWDFRYARLLLFCLTSMSFSTDIVFLSLSYYLFQ